MVIHTNPIWFGLSHRMTPAKFNLGPIRAVKVMAFDPEAIGSDFNIIFRIPCLNRKLHAFGQINALGYTH